MPRPVQRRHHQILHPLAQRLRHPLERLGQRILESDRRSVVRRGLDHPGAVGELQRVERRQVTERRRTPGAPLAGGNDRDGVRGAVGEVGRAVDRIERHVEVRRSVLPRAQPIAEKNAGRIVLDAFADDHLAADVHQIQYAVDGIARRRVGELLLTAAEPVDRVDGGIFGRADELELDRPLGVVRRQREPAVGHRGHLSSPARVPTSQDQEKISRICSKLTNVLSFWASVNHRAV
jgi:hypothetical protein